MKIYKSYKINIYHNNKIILCDDMSFINDNVLLFELIDYLYYQKQILMILR